MNEEPLFSEHTQGPGVGVLLTGSGLALAMVGLVWTNLLFGDHLPVPRQERAPAPVVATSESPEGLEQSAAATTNKFPVAHVNVEIAPSAAYERESDPLGQLILQTGSEPGGDMPVTTSAEPSLVLTAQTELARLQLFDGTVDGLPGADTREAIRKYQAINGLAVTGIVTRPLLDHIQMAGKFVQAGQTSVEMYQVQEGLAKLGYSPGPSDGSANEETRAAIRMFEADRGWPITGEPSPALLKELNG